VKVPYYDEHFFSIDSLMRPTVFCSRGEAKTVATKVRAAD